MQKKKPQTIWWLCMLPSLLLATILVYEWTQDQNETRLLVEALVCLVMGVGCGLFIVKNFMGSEDAEPDTSPKPVKPQQIDPSQSQSLGAMASSNLDDSAAMPQPQTVSSSGAPRPGTLEEAYALLDGKSSPAPAPAKPKATPLDVSVSEPVALALPPAPKAEPIALEQPAELKISPAPIELPSAPKSEPAAIELPPGPQGMEALGLEPEPVVAAAETVTGAEELPAGPQFEGLFDALQAAVPLSHSLDNVAAEKPAPTLKVEIAVRGAEQSNGNGKSDSVKVEFAVKGPQSNTTETQKVVRSLEEKVARIEAVAAKLEAAGKAEHEESPPKAPPIEVLPQELPEVATALDSDAKPRKLGTRELVRPLPALQTVAEWLDYASHLEDRANFDDAIKCYDKVSALDAANFQAWFRKGALLRKKGCFDDALYCMNYALRVDTKHGGALVEKGLCMVQLGRHDQAMTWFEKALSNDGEFVPALLGKARCLAAMGKHKEALPVYDKALRFEPGNAEVRKAREESAAKCPK